MPDFDPGGGEVVVVGHRFWRDELGADPEALGSRLELNGRDFTVVGVMSPGFAGSYPAFPSQIWAPVSLHERLRPLGIPLSQRGWGWLTGTGRLAEGVSLDQAQAEVQTIGRQLELDHPSANEGLSFGLVPATPLPEDLRGASEGLLGGLALVVGLILFAACANVGGVLMGRAMERQRELSVRSSIGASRGRLVRLLLAEALVIGGAGATLGLAVAAVTIRLLVRTLGSVDGMRGFAPEAHLGVIAVGFAYALALATAMLFGLLPALRAAQGGLLAGLRSDGNLAGSVRSRSWSALIVVQVAIASSNCK